jgi:hypothetical protein
MMTSCWIFFLGLSQLATLLGRHLADLLSTDRRCRDGIATPPQTARRKGGPKAAMVRRVEDRDLVTQGGGACGEKRFENRL